MKRYVTILLALLLTLVLAGCGEEAVTDTGSSGNEILVYYSNSSDTGLLSTIYSPSVAEGEEAIRETFGILQNGQYTDGHAAVPAALALDHVAWQESGVVLYLTGEYPAVGTVEEILCRSALVRTLVQFASVDGVSVQVNDVPLADESGAEFGILRSDDFLTDVSGSLGGEEEVELTLYFAVAEGNCLAAETVTVVRGSEESLESLVVEQLIAGPRSQEHGAVLPAGTGLISIQVKDEICYVNFDSGFSDGTFPAGADLAVYAVVNSLTELDGVGQVQFTVNGSADVTLGDSLSLVSPFGRNEDVISE